MREGRSRGVTSFDVARAAGVSQPTVSRAMRRLPSISQETTEKVLQAARDLGYVPHDTGRALSTRTTLRVAVVSAELTNPFYPELVEPLRAELDDAGYRTVLVPDMESEGDLVAAIADGSYDGVVLTTTLRGSRVPAELTALAVPHVLVNRVQDRTDSPSVAIDNVRAADQVAHLLHALGHTRIASVQGPVSTSTGKERGAAISAALRNRGVVIPRELRRRVAFSHDDAFAAARQLLSGSSRPSAVVCGNDVIAMGVLSAARSVGLRVPTDLSVIGFDDIPMSGWPLIDLTTIRSDLPGLARTAVGMLTTVIAGGLPPESSVRIAPTLIERGTHGPAAR